MTLLGAWLDSPVAAALGWAVIHSLWQGAAAAAVLAAVLLGVRQAGARYAISCGIMLAMLGALAVTVYTLLPDSAAGSNVRGGPLFPPWGAALYPERGGAGDSWTAALVPWLGVFWISGVWVFYSYQAMAWFASRRLLRRGVCGVSSEWQRRFDGCRERLRLSRTVRLLESSLVSVPIVFGHWKPTVLLPVGLLTGMPAGQVEAILLHELAHVRRFDYLVNLMQRAVEGILFYHPAIWWVSAVIRRERENCCDDLAVAVSGDAREYVCALAALEQSRPGHEPAMAATGGNLMNRVRRLLYPQREGSNWTPLSAAVLLVVTAGVVFAWQAGARQASPAKSEQSRVGGPYLAWLNEDVVYIIGDDERAAFLKLAADEERQYFIEQFWLRRDPTPGTPGNEFKDEHYRRIAFANGKFRTASGRPGWATDRGHMYIVYGPPDEIESHPKGGRIAYPFEEWLYHHIDGVGDNVVSTFIDRTRSGDYRVAPRALR